MKRRTQVKSFAVRVTDNASGRSVSFTVGPAFGRGLDEVVGRLHAESMRYFSDVTKVNDRRPARR